MTPTILILSGGGPAPATPLPRADFVIAADSGLDLAHEVGVEVDLVVGDMDSVSEPRLAAAEASGAAIDRHPQDKDATDLELAMLAAQRRGAGTIVVAGGGAGRLDHLLGVAALLADDRWADSTVEWHAGTSIVHVVRHDLVVPTEPGEIVSLIPVTPQAVVSIAGVRWPLDRAPLARGTSRGISNEALRHSVTVDIEHGVVLAVFTRGEP